MFAKAVLDSLNDSTELQLAKITLNGETHADVVRLQPFGLTSRPAKGAQALVGFVGGNRDNPVVIVCDDGRVRVKVSEGETAVYNQDGTKIVLKNNGTVEVDATTFKVNGNILATGDVLAGTISLKLHTHSGVTTGGGISGPPVG
jgi:phage baseplate assembly protein V